LIARPYNRFSTEVSTSRTNVNTPSAYSVGRTTRANVSNAVPSSEAWAMKPSAMSALDTAPT
jgi:hypothetical protein